MKVLIDECSPKPLMRHLANHGHECVTVRENRGTDGMFPEQFITKPSHQTPNFAGCRVPQVALFYLGVGSWPRNFQLFADGPNRPLFDFAMAWDAGDLVQGRLNQMLWAPPSRYKTHPWWRRWRSNSASFMLPLFRKPRAPRVGKGLFPQARAGIAAPA